MRTREQFNPHEVLGVSPTCEPELIDAAYQALIRKYRGDESEIDRIGAIDTAYAQLKGSQRRAGRDAAAASAAPPIIGTEMWQVKPRSRPEPALTRPAEAAPSPEPSFAHYESGDEITDRSARHWTIADWSNDQPPPPSELPPPANELVEDPRPDDDAGRSRYATPLVAGLGILGAALLTTLLPDRSQAPRPSKPPREAAIPAQPRPITSPQSTLQFPNRTAMVAAERTISQSDDVAKVAEDRLPDASNHRAAVSPAEFASQSPSTASKRPPAAQFAPSAPVPARTIAASVIPASPAPAREIAKPAPQQATEREPPQQAASPQPAIAMPARWISGGLQDSDNRNGRFAGSVAVRITVRPNGRTGGCRIAHSSGNPGLDQTTCRLLEERLLFTPAQDAAGRPLESEVGTTYVWGRRVRL